jgi:hypothetical protein
MTENSAEQQNTIVSEKNQGKTLYDASALEIIGKNFLAGFSHALGGVIIQIGFFVVLGYFATIYLWPQIQPMMNLLSRSVESMEQLQQTMQIPARLEGNQNVLPGAGKEGSAAGKTTVDPQLIQQLMQQYLGGTKVQPTPSSGL